MNQNIHQFTESYLSQHAIAAVEEEPTMSRGVRDKMTAAFLGHETGSYAVPFGLPLRIPTPSSRPCFLAVSCYPSVQRPLQIIYTCAEFITVIGYVYVVIYITMTSTR